MKRECARCGHAWEEAPLDYNADAEFVAMLEYNQKMSKFVGWKPIVEHDDPYFIELKASLDG